MSSPTAGLPVHPRLFTDAACTPLRLLVTDVARLPSTPLGTHACMPDVVCEGNTSSQPVRSSHGPAPPNVDHRRSRIAAAPHRTPDVITMPRDGAAGRQASSPVATPTSAMPRPVRLIPLILPLCSASVPPPHPRPDDARLSSRDRRSPARPDHRSPSASPADGAATYAGAAATWLAYAAPAMRRNAPRFAKYAALAATRLIRQPRLFVSRVVCRRRQTRRRTPYGYCQPPPISLFADFTPRYATHDAVRRAHVTPASCRLRASRADLSMRRITRCRHYTLARPSVVRR